MAKIDRPAAKKGTVNGGKVHHARTETSEITSCAEEKHAVDTGDCINNRYKVGRLLGKGGFGAVFEVVDQQTSEHHAVKVELEKPPPDMPGLSLETSVLKRVQRSPHFARFIESGTYRGINFLIMQLVGKNLADLRKACPHKKFTFNTAIRVGVQCFEAIEHMHRVGLLHRDIKPGNFTVGAKPKDARNIYLLDFGLVRKFRLRDGKVRPMRPRAAFRGTRRYASVNVLRDIDAGRQDDMIGWIYSVVELCTAMLPWPNEVNRKKLADYKEEGENRLFTDMHPVWASIYWSLKKLKYADDPPYNTYRRNMNEAMTQKGVKQTDPLDWEPKGEYHEHVMQSIFMKGPTKREKGEQVSGDGKSSGKDNHLD